MANTNSCDHCAKSVDNAALSSACDRCAKTVKTNDDFIECMGFCEQLIHARCANLNVPFIKNIRERSNLFWMCDECVKLMKFARFKSTVQSLAGTVSSLIESQQACISELREEIAKNGRQISQLAEKVNFSTPLRPIPGLSINRPSKRRRDEPVRPTFIAGTRVVDDCASLTVQPPPELFWIYLSRFHPTVTADVIERLAREGLQTTEPMKIIPLVKKGVDLSSMNFISFKVGVHPSLKSAALDPQSWPKGVVFRQFDDTSSKNLWMPPRYTPNVIEVATPSTSHANNDSTSIQ